MKFEVIAENPADRADGIGLNKGKAAARAARFTLEQPPFAGQPFTVAFDACPNPCCFCAELRFECRSENTAEPPRYFRIDLRKSRLTADGAEAAALGRAFFDEAPPSQWRQLWDILTATKRRQMDTMDLDSLEVTLPADAGEGALVQYTQVFPWAPVFDFTFQNEAWFASEQFCVRPGCTCREAALSFFHKAPGIRKLKPKLCVFYDYVTGKERPDWAHSRKLPVEALMQSLRAAHPGLSEALRRRHAQLKQLARRLLSEGDRQEQAPVTWASELRPPPEPAMAAKVGRNDPCPCGSGKKFKKCCGAG